MPAQTKRSRAFDIAEDLLNTGDFSTGMVNNDETVTSRIAESNANEWDVDDIVVKSAEFSKGSRDEITFAATVRLRGIQDPDRMWLGDRMKTDVEGIIKRDGNTWEIESYDCSNAQLYNSEEKLVAEGGV